MFFLYLLIFFIIFFYGDDIDNIMDKILFRKNYYLREIIECNYDKNEIQRVLKKGGYFIVNQHGTENLKEFVRLYMPFQMKGKWDAESCAQTLESIGMRVVDKFEDYGTIRFHSIQSLYQYFTKVSPDFANVNRYQVFYLQALKEMKDHSYFEMTTHQFLVVAQKTF